MQYHQKPGYILILVEHKSYQKKEALFQLWHYLIDVMQSMSQQYPKGEMPLILPLIFYHGRTPWRVPRHWLELFADPHAARQLLLSPLQVIDVGQIHDKILLQHPISGLMELTCKYACQKNANNLLSHIRKCHKILRNTVLSEDDITTYLKDTFLYTFNRADIDSYHALSDTVSECLTKNGDDSMPSLAQRIRQEGIEQGIERGIEQGMKKGYLEIARRMIRSGMDEHEVMRVTGLSHQELTPLHV